MGLKWCEVKYKAILVGLGFYSAYPEAGESLLYQVTTLTSSTDGSPTPAVLSPSIQAPVQPLQDVPAQF